MNCDMYCSMYFIIKESFMKRGTSRGAFFCLFLSCFFEHRLPFPSPSRICFNGVKDSNIIVCFYFLCQGHMRENATDDA